jgi:hypothetical protein
MYVPDATSPKQPRVAPVGGGQRNRHLPNLADSMLVRVYESRLPRAHAGGRILGRRREGHDVGARLLAGKMALGTISTSIIGRAIPAASAAEVAGMNPPAISQNRSSEQSGKCLLLAALFPFEPVFVLLPVGPGSAFRRLRVFFATLRLVTAYAW